jgi:Domain of unknown function (DUF4412)
VEEGLKRSIWLALLMALAPMGLRAQGSGFEGAVSMTMHASGQTIPVDYAIKGHKARIEMHTTGRTNVILIDLDAHTQTILIPELKAFAVHTGDSETALSSTAPPKVTDLGTTETIAGHGCEEYKVETEKYSGIACMTKEFGENPLTDTLSGPLHGALKGDQTLRKAGMPLKVDITFKEAGKQGDKAMVEVTKVSPGPVDEAQLTVPDGWHKLSGLPGMQ